LQLRAAILEHTFVIEESLDEELARLLATAPDRPPLDEVLDRIVTDGPAHSGPTGWSALELDTGTPTTARPRTTPGRPQPVPPPRDTWWQHADPPSDGDPAPF
jgi:hypothetical protein